MGKLDDTPVIYNSGDNGSSAGGTPLGSPSEVMAFNGVSLPVADRMKFYDCSGFRRDLPAHGGRSPREWSWGMLSRFADHAGSGGPSRAKIVAVIGNGFEGKEERLMKMMTLAMVYLVDRSSPAAGLRFATEIQRAGSGVPAAPTIDDCRSRSPADADHPAAECNQSKCQRRTAVPSGGWQMPAQAQHTIAKMAAILAPQQTTKINVNGYTDNTPIGPGLMRQGVTSNLILSQRRADNMMQYMISQGVNPNLVSAQGFGDADPVASNATPEGRAQNRRVELTLANSGS